MYVSTPRSSVLKAMRLPKVHFSVRTCPSSPRHPSLDRAKSTVDLAETGVHLAFQLGQPGIDLSEAGFHFAPELRPLLCPLRIVAVQHRREPGIRFRSRHHRRCLFIQQIDKRLRHRALHPRIG